MATREATVIATARDARRLGRYVLLGEIAEGGMGRIYLARTAGAAGFEKIFALKIMHQGLAERNPDLGEMFLDEARINSLVRHPNVCAVHDFGEAQGVRYLVMEYMVGQTLLDVLRRIHSMPGIREHPMFWPYAARIVAEASEGLHAAHTAVDEHGQPMGVIHRDISPENVFMTYTGAVKVFDFGIASATGRRHQTVAGTFKGKFAYAAPEAFGGEGVDLRADIWSMGVVLWELLAGRALFHRQSEAETMGAIFQDAIPPVATFVPACPPELQRIVEGALERDRERRYQSARDMARELNRFAVQSGEHLGTAEIGEWMRALFTQEYEASLETGRSVKRLDAQMVDEAPALDGSGPPDGLISQVVERQHTPGPTRPEPGRARGLTAEPTVVHQIYEDVDEEEETRLANSPLAPEIFIATSEVSSPRPIADFAERDVSSSVTLGRPSPFDEGAGSGVSGVSEVSEVSGGSSPTAPAATAGEPSPFVAPPEPEPKKRRMIGTPMRIVLALSALAGGIYIADMATAPPAEEQAPTPEEGVSVVEPEAETVPADHDTPAEESPPTASATSTETETEPVAESEPEPVAEPEPEPEPVAESEPDSDSEERAGRRSSASGRRGSHRTMHRDDTTPPAMSNPSGEPGELTVFAVGGWADIYEGSRRLGRTPARLSLPAGRHLLTLRPPEGDEVRRSVDVPAGGTARLRIEL